MTGTRLPDGSDWSSSTPPGAYWRRAGHWFAVTPSGQLVDVTTWTVTEHEDQTITVAPSILVQAIPPKSYTPEERVRMVDLAGEDYVQKWEHGKPAWHGYLEAGVWREC